MAHLPVRPLAAVHHLALAELDRARRGAARRRSLRAAIGADDDSGGGYLDWITQRYEAATAQAAAIIDHVESTPGRVTDWMRSQAQASADTLLDVARDAGAAGLDYVADAATTIASSLGTLASTYSDAWRDFWGVSPAVMLGVAGLAGLAVLTGGGYILVTGGGQALLGGAGKALGGAGAALAKAL